MSGIIPATHQKREIAQHSARKDLLVDERAVGNALAECLGTDVEKHRICLVDHEGRAQTAFEVDRGFSLN
jgi:hypothetical protein